MAYSFAFARKLSLVTFSSDAIDDKSLWSTGHCRTTGPSGTHASFADAARRGIVTLSSHAFL